MTLEALRDEGWTRTELASMSRSEIIYLAQEHGLRPPMNATKADLVALVLGDIDEIPQSPEDMLRVAVQYRAWVRGVPPGDACLTAADKFYLQNLFHILDPVWYL